MTSSHHSLDPIFRPRSIAIVGASRKKGSIGREILHNLMEYEFNGKIFPVNPSAEVIHSIKCFPNVSSIPDVVDLAVIVVPKHQVLEIVDECGRRGIRGLVVITAGFKEVGPEGQTLEEQLRRKIRQYGIRMIGPNCMGLINTDLLVRENCTFSPTEALTGNVGFMSQSGALGVAILNIARKINLGFSYFVSMGNKTDVSGNDLLEYWEHDPRTQIILMYLESFGNPRKFTQIARRISRQKPILVVKSGRTSQGARAASSHTGAMAGMDIAIDALLEQCGVIRVNTVEELFDVAIGFSNNPIPRGSRVAILTNAGGPAIMATDACVSAGLIMAEFSETTRKHLQDYLPPEASILNPVDMIASANKDSYAFCLDVILKDEGVDAVIVTFVPPIMINPIDIVQSIERIRKNHGKPVLGVIMARDEFFDEVNEVAPDHLPLYLFPESAARTLSAMVRYARWRARPHSEVVSFKVDRERAAELFSAAKASGRDQLSLVESMEVLRAYGIPVAKYALAKNRADALNAARAIGFPLVLKVVSSKLTHKSDFGGVIVDLRTEQELDAAFDKLERQLSAAGLTQNLEGYLLQEMVRGGKEVILGMTLDPHYGPLLMFGLGGIFVETIKDVVFRITPITQLESHEMIRNIRGFPLLEGVRGDPSVALDLLAECLQRLSQLVGDFQEIEEIDVNPFSASTLRQNSKALDARIRISRGTT
ncbi:MAG: acetate--CoA ligase family protein [Acidobacteriia bacterium]|nr:acetate--CoA ligase family protein [Terriglobia bacterium]